MPATVVDNRKRTAASPPTNKIVASSGLPKNDAPAGLGSKTTSPVGARPPAQKGPSRVLLKQLEESAPYPDTFEAQCYWVLARHDLSEASAWAANASEGDASVVNAFEKHLGEYRASGRPVGFLSEASTAPDDEEGSDAEAAAVHAETGDVTAPSDAELRAKLNAAVEAWFGGTLADPSDEVLAKAKQTNPSLYEKCLARDKAAKEPSSRREDGATEFNVVDAAAGKPAFKKRWSATKREKAQKMLAEGASAEVVAEAVDMPVDSVQAYALELSQMAGSTASTQEAVEAPAAVHPEGGKVEVYKTSMRVEVKVDPLPAPASDVLGHVLVRKNQQQWAPDGSPLGTCKQIDELIAELTSELNAARWLKQNGVK